MATLIIFSKTSDGTINSAASGTYSTARAMTTPSSTDSTSQVNIGQRNALGQYTCYETFYQFDTSRLQNLGTVSTITLATWTPAASDFTDTEFTIQARIKDWGTTLTTADAVAGASLSALTLVATRATSGMTYDGYANYTESGTDFYDNLSRTGDTRLILNSSRHSGNNTPSNNEYIQPYAADRAGTANDPKLTIVYAALPQIQVF